MTIKIMPPGFITNARHIFTTVDGWHIDGSFIKEFKITNAFGIYNVIAITRDNSAWIMHTSRTHDEAKEYLSSLSAEFLTADAEYKKRHKRIEIELEGL